MVSLRSMFGFQRNANLYLESVSMSSLAQGAYGVIQGLYILALGYDEKVLGTVLSARMLWAAIASLPAGVISDRIGRKPVLIAAGLLTTVGFLGQALFSSASMMVLFSSLVGVAMACQATTGAPLLAESSTDEDRARLFGVNFSLSMAVNMVGSLLGGYLPRLMGFLGEVNSFKFSLAFFSGITFLGVFPALRMTENKFRQGMTDSRCLSLTKDEEDGSMESQEFPGKNGRRKMVLKRMSEEARSLWMTARTPDVLNLLNYSMIIGFGAGLVIPFFNVFLSKKLSLDTGTVGLILSFSQGATALAGLLAPVLAEKYGKVRAIVWTQVASVPFLLLIALPPNVYLVSFALFVRSALMNMSNPVASNFSMEIVPKDRRGTVSSLMRIADNVSRALSAYAAGYIMHRWNYETPYFLTAALYIAASWVYWKAFSKREDQDVEI